MTAARSRAARARLVAAITTVLILLGTGGAAAYWTASAQLTGSASAGSVGVTQNDPLKLQTIYDSGHLKVSDTVTIRNTGTAPADLSVAVTAQAGSTLAPVLQVAIAKKANTEVCGPDTALAQPVTGGMGLRFTSTLAAGEVIDLCVRTSIPARAVFGHADQDAQLSVTSTLTYASGAKWTASTSGTIGAPVPQRVNADPAAGVPAAECRSIDPLLLPSSLRFTYSDLEVPTGTEYRAYLLHGTRIMEIPLTQSTFRVGQGTVSVEVLDRDLAKIKDDLGLWQSMNVRIVIEEKAPASGEWVTSSTGKLYISDRLLVGDRATCGWR